MVGKTAPELSTLSAPVVDTDVLAVYRSPGPLKQTTASVFKTYANLGLGITNIPATFNTFGGFGGNSTITGVGNVGYGYGAGTSITSGFSNVVIGRLAANAGAAISLSVAIGQNAMRLVPGMADGTHANDTNNIAIGTNAMGDTAANPQHSVAVGYFALSTIGSAPYNVAIGYQAMQSATGVAEANVALGAKTLEATTGDQNTACGHLSMFSSGSGSNNAAVGYASLYGTTTGGSNVGVGYCAGAGGFAGLSPQVNNTTGDQNTFVGPFAGCSVATLTGATAIGARATVSADYTVAIGASSVQSAYEAKVVIAGSTADERLHVKNGNAKVEGSLILNTGSSGRVKFATDASIYSNASGQISIRNAADSAYAALFTGQITAVGEGYFGASSDVRLGGAYGVQGLYRPGAMTVRSDDVLTVHGVNGLTLTGAVSTSTSLAVGTTLAVTGVSTFTGNLNLKSQAVIDSTGAAVIKFRNAANTAGADIYTKDVFATGEGYFGASTDIRVGGAYGEQGLYRATAMTVRSDAVLKLVGSSITVEGAVASNSTIKTGGYTVATLPAAGTVGRRAYVTDALAPTYLGALVGGGAIKCPVFDNGTAWVSG